MCYCSIKWKSSTIQNNFHWRSFVGAKDDVLSFLTFSHHNQAFVPIHYMVLSSHLIFWKSIICWARDSRSSCPPISITLLSILHFLVERFSSGKWSFVQMSHRHPLIPSSKSLSRHLCSDHSKNLSNHSLSFSFLSLNFSIFLSFISYLPLAP